MEQDNYYKIDLENPEIDYINRLIYEKDFFLYVINLPINIIDDLIQKGLEFPTYLVKNNDLIEKYTNILDIERLRMYITHLKDNNEFLYRFVSKSLDEKYKEIINNINDKGIYQYYYDSYLRMKNNDYSMYIPTFILKKDISEKVLIDKTKELLISIICDKYFKDYKTNVLINIESMLEYNKNINIIPNNRLNLYEAILNYINIDPKYLINIYNSINEDIQINFYTDLRNIKDKAYDEINKNLLDITSLKKITINSINVYILDEDDYYIPIHTTQMERRNFSYSKWNERKKDTISVSIINKDNNLTYTNPKKYAAFGFKELPKEKIIHMYNEDSYSNGKNEIDKINMIKTIDDFMNETNGYNETLLLKTSFNYLICFDKVTLFDINICKNMNNIPILLIGNSNLSKQKKYIRHFDYKKYKMS